MRFVPDGVLIRLIRLSEDEKRIRELLRQGSNLLNQVRGGDCIDELDWRAYEDSQARTRTSLDRYSGRFGPYFNELLAENERIANV